MQKHIMVYHNTLYIFPTFNEEVESYSLCRRLPTDLCIPDEVLGRR